jgi:hypothetical protein
MNIEEYKKLQMGDKSFRPPQKYVDKANDFMNYINILDKSLLNGMVREYRFCAQAVGGEGKGLRERLKKEKLQDWRFDFAWPGKKVAVEIDGGLWLANGGRHNTDGDRHKINIAQAMGWTVFRFSIKTMNDDPKGCLDMVKRKINDT